MRGISMNPFNETVRLCDVCYEELDPDWRYNRCEDCRDDDIQREYDIEWEGWA